MHLPSLCSITIWRDPVNTACVKPCTRVSQFKDVGFRSLSNLYILLSIRNEIILRSKQRPFKLNQTNDRACYITRSKCLAQLSNLKLHIFILFRLYSHFQQNKGSYIVLTSHYIHCCCGFILRLMTCFEASRLWVERIGNLSLGLFSVWGIKKKLTPFNHVVWHKSNKP